MLNTILLFVLTYIIITIFVNLMIFYVNDEFKDLIRIIMDEKE